MLGVEPDASSAEIRDAFRARARLAHPDTAVAPSRSGEMATLNEAYRVLSHPEQRSRYDGQLASSPGRAAPGDGDVDRESDESGLDDRAVSADRPTFLSPDGPARFPWRFVLVLALVGSAAVLATSVLDDPPTVQPPDGILHPESCVSIDPNGDAREIACSSSSDRVVEALVPLDGTCPLGTVGHRDRLGLGIACLRP